jgi:hypothetical protein
MAPPKTSPAHKNQRQYPRAPIRVKARLTMGPPGSPQFEATLNTRDVSVSGIFFESSFFLKVGQTVDVQLDLPPDNREVSARGRVVRIETRDHRGKEASGFAVHFQQFFDSSEVVLANYFMSEVLKKFVEEYARRRKVRFSSAEMGAILDVLASWELSQSLHKVEVWQTPRSRA